MPEDVLHGISQQIASLEPGDVASCLATAASEPVEEPQIDETTLAGAFFDRRSFCYEREPKRAHFRRVLAALGELDALARTCRRLHVLCWTAPIAAQLPNPSDVLRVLCRLGFSRAYRTALPLHDPASQLSQHACDRYRISAASTRGTLLHAAVLSGSREMVATVLEGFWQHVDVPDNHGHTPLYLASVYRRSARGDDGVVSLLLEARANPDAHSGRCGEAQAPMKRSSSFNPHTALVAACRRRDLGVVTTLLRRRADVNNCEVGFDGEEGGEELGTPVRAAVRLDVGDGRRRLRFIDDANERILLLGVLLAAGADVDGLAPEEKEIGVGRTALHIAVRDDASGLLAAALLQARASVNISDAWDASPLHFACFYGRVRSTRVLLEARADPTALDSDGKTPREVLLKRRGRCTAQNVVDIKKLLGMNRGLRA